LTDIRRTLYQRTCFRRKGITLERIPMKEQISHAVSFSIPTGQDAAEIPRQQHTMAKAKGEKS